MKPVDAHTHPKNLARLICLVVIMVLAAHPALATVAASMDCTGQCCCAGTGPVPAAAIAGAADRDAGCCGPSGSGPCHMSAGSLPAVEPGLIQTAAPSPVDAIHLLPGKGRTVARWSHDRSPTASVDTASGRCRLPLYLEACRLIC